METHEDILAALPLFKGLKPEQIRQIAACAETAQYEAGQFLGREGEPAESFWVVRQGHIALETHAPARGPLTLQTVSTDDVIGWSWLIPPHRWLFDAHVVEDTSAVVFDGTCLRGKCDADPVLGYALLQRVAQVMLSRLQAARVRLLDLYGVPGASSR